MIISFSIYFIHRNFVERAIRLIDLGNVIVIAEVQVGK